MPRNRSQLPDSNVHVIPRSVVGFVEVAVVKSVFHFRVNEIFPEVSKFFILPINFGTVEVKTRLASGC